MSAIERLPAHPVERVHQGFFAVHENVTFLVHHGLGDFFLEFLVARQAHGLGRNSDIINAPVGVLNLFPARITINLDHKLLLYLLKCSRVPENDACWAPAVFIRFIY
jgi:hypothetical protein